MQKVDKYYEKNKKSYESLFNFKSKTKIEMSENDKQYYLTIIDDNGKSIKFQYELAGVFNVRNSVWYWGWDIELVDKNLTKSIKSVKSFYKFILENNDEFTQKEAEDLYFRTKNNNFYLNKLNNMEQVLRIALYLTKSLWYLPIGMNKDGELYLYNGGSNESAVSEKIQFILIKNIANVK